MKIGLMQRMPQVGWLRARSKSTSTCWRERCENRMVPSGWKDVYWLGRSTLFMMRQRSSRTQYPTFQSPQPDPELIFTSRMTLIREPNDASNSSPSS